MKLFECCKNCEHSWSLERFVFFCDVDGLCRKIEFPRLMGGSRRCECYERLHRPKMGKYYYPKKEKKNENT